MIRTITLTLFLFVFISAHSQNIEVIGGLNKNIFFDLQQKEGHYSSSYNPDYGYAIRFGVEDIKVDWMTFRFTLGYDKYGGEFTVSDGGQGGGSTTEAVIDKSVISLSVFPLNFKIINRIDLNFGLEFSGLIRENFSGTRSGWILGEPDWSYGLKEKHERFSAKTYFGLSGRIAYDFNISDRLAISPQYSYYFGLSNEFDEFPEATKSMRHYFCVGIQRTLK